jgi:hypothetical protein
VRVTLDRMDANDRKLQFSIFEPVTKTRRRKTKS